MESYIIFEGAIDQEATNRLKNALEIAFQPGVTKIVILFSSLGGSIYEGFLLATIIKNFKIPIQIHATNHIDSIANIIYLAAQERTSESYAKFYMHGASAGGTFDEKMMIDKLSDIKTNNSRIAYFISENSNLSVKKVQKMMKEGTTISAQDALKYEIVQQITHKVVPTGALRQEIIYIN